MDMKKTLLIFLLAAAVIFSVGTASAGLFDDLLIGGEQDNTVEIENITFSITNDTEFEYVGMDDSEEWNVYGDENLTEYQVFITNCSQLNDSEWDFEVKEYEDDIANITTLKVNGIDVSNETISDGNSTIEVWYGSFIIDNDHKTMVELYSTDPDETAKMASTFKFK